MLIRSLAALLFVLVSTGFALAQDPSGPDSSAPADQTQVTEPGAGLWLLAEPKFVSQGLDFANTVFGDGTTPPKTGFYPEFSNMITGSGFISAGPGYRVNFDGGKAFFDTSAAVSWHLYKMAQARLEFSQLASDHVTIGVQGMWQDNTQVSYFGTGPGAVLEDQSQYRIQTADAVGYAAVRPSEWLSVGAEVGWLKRPRIMETAGTFKPNHPDARLLYPQDPGMSDAYQPNFLHSELSVTANTLDSRSHPTYGGLYRAAMTSYRDQADGVYSFDQYEVEAVQMVPLGDSRFVIGLHGWTVFSDVKDGHAVPFYMLPVLGGNNTIRAYDDYQFHDQNTVLATAELRIAVLAHLDAAVFYDAGNVAGRWRDLNFDKTAIGGGLRLHLRRATFARMDIAHGAQGWTAIFRTSEPLKLSRVARRLASVPFMP